MADLADPGGRLVWPIIGHLVSNIRHLLAGGYGDVLHMRIIGAANLATVTVPVVRRLVIVLAQAVAVIRAVVLAGCADEA